jgi:hypothetical protein
MCTGAFLAAKFHDPYPSWIRDNLGLNIVNAATRYPDNPVGFKGLRLPLHKCHLSSFTKNPLSLKFKGRHKQAAVELSPIAIGALGVAPQNEEVSNDRSSTAVINMRFAGMNP